MSDFGTPNYGGKKEFKKKNDWSLEQGDQTYRIVPPRGNLKDSGRWNKFYAVVWGFKNSQGKLRPFASPLERNQDKTIKNPCAATDFIDNLKARLQKAKEDGNQQAVDSLTALCEYNGATKKPALYSLDKKYHMNVVDINGNVGKLKIGHKVKQSLDVEIQKLRDAGIDPLSPEDGRFFTFSKSGQNRDTNVKISVYKQKIDIPGIGMVEKDLSHKIDAALANKIKEEAFDLERIFTIVTAEECKAIVENVAIGTGISPVCDEVFDARWKAQRESKMNSLPNKDNVTPYEYNNAHSAVRPAPQAPAQLATPAPAVVTPVVVAPKATAQPVAAKAPAPAVDLDSMSNDDFFAAIGQ